MWYTFKAFVGPMIYSTLHTQQFVLLSQVKYIMYNAATIQESRVLSLKRFDISYSKPQEDINNFIIEPKNLEEIVPLKSLFVLFPYLDRLPRYKDSKTTKDPRMGRSVTYIFSSKLCSKNRVCYFSGSWHVSTPMRRCVTEKFE